MAREYRHLQMYEKEILELREQGLTQREIAARFGVSYEKMHDFFKRYNRKQRQLAAGIEIRPKRQTAKRWCKAAAVRSAIKQSFTITIRTCKQREIY